MASLLALPPHAVAVVASCRERECERGQSAKVQLHCVLTRRVQLMAWGSRACSSNVVLIGAVDRWRAIMSANFSRSYVREMDSAKT